MLSWRRDNSENLIGYHATSEKMLERYIVSHCILPPVRCWVSLDLARRWGKRKERPIILEVHLKDARPMGTHQPPNAAWISSFPCDSWIVMQ